MRDNADAFRAATIDIVLRQQPLVLIELGRKTAQERIDSIVKPARQVFAQPPDADIAREEAEPGDELVDVEEQLALTDRVEEHRDGADLHRVRPKPDEMARQTLQFGNEDSYVLYARRHLETEHLLYAERVRQTVRLGGQVIHPLDERYHLLPLLLLGGFLDSGVQVPDRRVRGTNDLAIELEHQPEHAVRAGVLRPHVHRHRFRAQFSHGYSACLWLWALVSCPELWSPPRTTDERPSPP